ncbi:hypothetical protein [Streptomyces sp. NPDC090021]|uniref:hypothetical protein n=1 Tax=Streptomyces sp. NPDC090021 TaxID=3365919 RepID=UPI00382E7140
MGALALAGLPAQAGAAEATLPSTPQAYAAWLEAKQDAGASETAEQFKALPKDKQEKFLGYLNKPDHIKAFMDVANDPTAKQKCSPTATSSSPRRPRILPAQPMRRDSRLRESPGT